MIEIVYTPGKYRIEMSGHAGAGPKGADLVCCGVSSLFYCLATALSESKELLKKDSFIVVDEESAEVKVVECKPKGGCEEPILRTFWTIIQGIDALYKQYPQCIHFDVNKEI